MVPFRVRLLISVCLLSVLCTFVFPQDVADQLARIDQLQRSYPDVKFVCRYEPALSDIEIVLTSKNEEKRFVLFWSGGRMLPAEELVNIATSPCANPLQTAFGIVKIAHLGTRESLVDKTALAIVSVFGAVAPFCDMEKGTALFVALDGKPCGLFAAGGVDIGTENIITRQAAVLVVAESNAVPGQWEPFDNAVQAAVGRVVVTGIKTPQRVDGDNGSAPSIGIELFFYHFETASCSRIAGLMGLHMLHRSA